MLPRYKKVLGSTPGLGLVFVLSLQVFLVYSSFLQIFRIHSTLMTNNLDFERNFSKALTPTVFVLVGLKFINQLILLFVKTVGPFIILLPLNLTASALYLASRIERSILYCCFSPEFADLALFFH